MEQNTEIILFVKNFQLGTKLSEVLIDNGKTVTFADDEQHGLSQVNDATKMAFIDLDDPVFQTMAFVSGLRNINADMKIIGYMKIVHKETYDRLRAAGCDLILPQSSLVKNIPSLVN